MAASRYRIAEQRRWWSLRVLAWILIPLVIAGLAYQWGKNQGFRHQVDVLARARDMSKKLAVASLRIVELEKSQAVNSQASRIDEIAITDLQAEITRLERKIEGLEGDVDLYRRIIEPYGDKKRLVIKELRISRLNSGLAREPAPGDEADAPDQAGTATSVSTEAEAAGNYVFEATLIKLDHSQRLVRGRVKISLSGTMDGQEKAFDMENFSDVTAAGIAFRFRNYQEIARTFSLPRGFVPDSIHIEARTRNKVISGVSQTFAWTEILAKEERVQ